MLHLFAGIQTALSQYADQYQELHLAATLLQDIANLLEPPADQPVTGGHIAQKLRSYLDNLLDQTSLSPQLASFCLHLDKVSRSYWPGLFHCYNLDALPRANNDLESHFRDTERLLLRTNGQRGLTRRTLHRFGAWELLPRPPTLTESIRAFQQIQTSELAKEQHHFRIHRQRFRLHTRSSRQLDAQFTRLRLLWHSLPTSTG